MWLTDGFWRRRAVRIDQPRQPGPRVSLLRSSVAMTGVRTRRPEPAVNAETTRLVRDKPHHVIQSKSRFGRLGETPEMLGRHVRIPNHGHLVSATAASAAEANNCRRADSAVIHPRCCHSRSASESPAITTSPNGMER